LSSMDLQLANKVFIVTGGSSGIGAAISKCLAAEGAIVVIADRKTQQNHEWVDHIVKLGGQAADVTVELTDTQACKEVIDFTINKYGRIDGVVNNAGINDGVGIENGSPEKFVESLRLNLVHYYNIVHFALPHLKNTKGAIVNISSKTAETGQGNTSGYASAKGGVNALTREWAAELAPHGIRVNCVVPSEVWTPLYEWWVGQQKDPEEKIKSIVSRIPLEKRFTKTEEIADMVVFLLSPRSGHTTGQLVHVDGGYVHLDRALT
jgi:L-fucose dehydrogenase